jgi:carbamate kinase
VPPVLALKATQHARAARADHSQRVTCRGPGELTGYEFAAGSMGPKAEAAARFVARTGRRATIGSLADIAGIVAGDSGTNVVAQHDMENR